MLQLCRKSVLSMVTCTDAPESASHGDVESGTGESEWSTVVLYALSSRGREFSVQSTDAWGSSTIPRAKSSSKSPGTIGARTPSVKISCNMSVERPQKSTSVLAMLAVSPVFLSAMLAVSSFLPPPLDSLFLDLLASFLRRVASLASLCLSDGLALHSTTLPHTVRSSVA
ncbi:hypothetical protein BDZ89DRAFT_504930 [Hymenopellis radicata]|nr:hypothetical protein BDZ89DRAFT_504930 [Hymenopellis radicata]